eukprot:6194992-Pleurochrysis_carterae.AAC.2
MEACKSSRKRAVRKALYLVDQGPRHSTHANSSRVGSSVLCSQQRTTACSACICSAVTRTVLHVRFRAKIP